jgi:hypothetical protein
MKLTRSIFLAVAFLIPSVATVAKAEEKPAAEAPAEGAKPEKKAKKSKKKAAEGEKKEEAAPAAK